MGGTPKPPTPRPKPRAGPPPRRGPGLGLGKSPGPKISVPIGGNSGVAGNIEVSEANALTLRRAAQTNAAAAGNIVVSTTAGTLTVEGSGTGGLGVSLNGATATGAVTLEASGNNNDLVVNHTVATT